MSGDEHARQPAIRRRRIGTQPKLALVLCTLALLPILLMHAVALHRGMTGLNTGDPFMDKLARVSFDLSKRHRTLPRSVDIDSFHSTQLYAEYYARELMEAMPEGRWGGDPRWYELMYTMDYWLSYSLADGIGFEDRLSRSAGFLDQAVSERIARPQAVYQLLHTRRRQWYVECGKKIGGPLAFYYRIPSEGRPAFDAEVNRELERQHGAEIEDMWQAIMAVTADNSYFPLVRMLEEDGDPHEVLGSAGSPEALRIEPLGLSPAAELLAAASDGRFDVDPVLCYMALSAYDEDYQFAATYGLGDRARAAVQAGRLDELNAWYRLTCLLGQGLARAGLSFFDQTMTVGLLPMDVANNWPKSSAPAPQIDAGAASLVSELASIESLSDSDWLVPRFYSSLPDKRLRRFLDPSGYLAVRSRLFWDNVTGTLTPRSREKAQQLWAELAEYSYK